MIDDALRGLGEGQSLIDVDEIDALGVLMVSAADFQRIAAV